MPRLGEALRAVVSDKEEPLEIKGRPESVLMSPTRQKIFEHICHFPASRLRAIAKKLNMNTTVVHFHLRKMKQHQYATTFQVNGKKVYFPFDLRPTEEDLVSLCILADDAGRELLKNVVDAPGLTASELASKTHRSAAGTRKIILEMESQSLVALIVDGRRNRIFPGDGLPRMERRSRQLLRGLKSRLMRRLARDRLSPTIEMDERRESIIILKVGGRSYRLKIPAETLLPWATS